MCFEKNKRKQPEQIINLLVMSAMAVICLLPVVLVFVASFSSEASLASKGFSFFPEAWSFNAWKYVLGYGGQLIKSYMVTIASTVLGTLLSLLFMSLMAYTLTRKNFVLRRFLTILLIVSMLFSGGDLSSYLINTTVYHLKDKFLVLIIPSISAIYVIIIRTYIQENITDALIESAKIDGAGEFTTYCRIVLPLLKPVLASIGFMLAVQYWNEWKTGMLYIQEASLTPLQVLLMRIEKRIEVLQTIPLGAASGMTEMVPQRGARMAILVTVLGPIMVAYPFFQKYFVKGLTLGSVKG